MSRKIRVIQYGVGATGSMIVRLMGTKKGLQIVGAIDRNPKLVGKDLSEVADLDKRSGITVSDDPDAVLSKTRADIVLHTTTSFIEDVCPQIANIVQAGINVISTCEELSYPYVRYAKLARKIDALAKKHKVTVLATGANPGYMLDTLVITLTGVCHDIRSIKVVRTIDVSPFGPSALDHTGLGTTPDDFKKRMEEGRIVGHIGLPESMAMIADALGWKLDDIKQTIEPIISKTYREAPYFKIEPGEVGGLKQACYGTKGDKPIISLEMFFHILPEAEGIKEGQYIHIDGVPSFEFTLNWGPKAYLATSAIAVNMIPHVIRAKPGFVTMKDLPIPAARMADFRDFIKNPS